MSDLKLRLKHAPRYVAERDRSFAGREPACVNCGETGWLRDRSTGLCPSCHSVYRLIVSLARCACGKTVSRT